MSKTKKERLAEVHARALERFDKIQTAVADERKQCAEDRRFYSLAGAQWEGQLGEQFANKPQIEVNKIHLSVIRIFSEYRANRITVDFQPKDGSANDDLADACDGLYRADEQDSGAQEAYDNAFEEAVGGGIGAFRLRACYENEDDDEDERQRIRFEPITDADTSVFFDIDAKRQDKADAKFAYVLTPMSREAYKEEYGDDPSTWPKELANRPGGVFDWLTPDVVWVAEYYEVEKTRELIRIFVGLDQQEVRFTDEELTEDPEKLDTLLATGFREVRQKRIKRCRVHKYTLSGGGVLEDEYVAGRHIPIVVTYGKRWVIDGVERCMGHVRLAKDAQRLKNMQLSKLAELSAESSVEKPIFLAEQVVGHRQMWEDDNVNRYPYLLLNPVTDPATGQLMPTGPVGYTKPPQIPPALAALLQLTETDMQDLLGNQQAAEKLQSNVSGDAIELVQNRLDMQSFIYMDNFGKAIRRAGQIWLSMARDLYVEEGRKMKTAGADGKAGSIELMRPIVDETGAVQYENDLSRADFDVAVEVGPSSSSKRASTVKALTALMTYTQDPETMQVLSASALMNMEGEGLSDIREYFRRKLIRIGAAKPTDEEAQRLAAEMANTPPDPQSLYLQKAAEAEEAKAAKARADTVETIASAGLKEAQTQKTLAEAGGTATREALDVADALRQAAEPLQGQSL